jgi:hypothetical protein
MSTFKSFVLLAILLVSIVSLTALTPDWLWSQRAGGSDNDGTTASVVDAAGNSYITGFFVGTAVFGTTTLTSSITKCFVAKMDSNGNWLWAKTPENTGVSDAMAIAIDPLGNVYIMGNFDGSATFGVSTITTGGLIDIYIAKLNPDGNWIWARGAGGTRNDAGRSMDVDNSGNVYIVGEFDRNATFGTTSFSIPNGKDVFVAKLSTDGLWAWAKQTGGANNIYSKDIAIDDNGNAYFTGYFSGSITFGDSTYTSAGSNDIYVAKLDTAGGCAGFATAGGTGNDHAEHIAVDNAGNCYITGGYAIPATFGNVTYNGYGGIVAKLDADRNWVWLSQANGATMYDVVVDNAQNVYLTGGFGSIGIFGNITIYGEGNSDVFVTKLNSAGNWLWVQKAGGTGDDFGMGLGIDSALNIYLAGFFYDTCAFGTITLASAGQEEVFVAKLNGTVAVSDEVIVPNAAFTLKQNYPNPFNTATEIKIDVLDNKAPYTLAIYDLKGRKVCTVHDGLLSKGENIFNINSKDILTDKLASGLYYYRLTNGTDSQTKKMVLMK